MYFLLCTVAYDVFFKKPSTSHLLVRRHQGQYNFFYAHRPLFQICNNLHFSKNNQQSLILWLKVTLNIDVTGFNFLEVTTDFFTLFLSRKGLFVVVNRMSSFSYKSENAKTILETLVIFYSEFSELFVLFETFVLYLTIIQS